MPTEEIRVKGIVQGVGFRPTVYRIATDIGLSGEICNDGEGVLIRVAGSDASLDQFVRQLQQESPLLARIESITRSRNDSIEVSRYHGFRISDSVDGANQTQITPDAATCPQCQSEIFDPSSRWFRYPFTNCTHCGPRFSIIRTIPYDRKNTSMGVFSMCPECSREYDDVTNRRFHAQPIACHICGPKAWLERADGKPVTASMFSMLDDVDAVCTLLQKGEIVAIKGIGGFHLACDATNDIAVQKLRQRKGRYDKPFALMARDIRVIEEYCTPNIQELELLTSPAAPIVLLKKKKPEVSNPIAESVSPKQNYWGFMLPYTPLHHLIFKRMNRPVVMTSGNISDEPQCIDNNEARTKLVGIADYFLFHNREIVNHVDDSVVRVVDSQPRIIRRARGYTPTSIKLPLGFEKTPDILAMGGELKNTFCLLRDGKATLSQHLGDLSNYHNFQNYQKTLDLYLDLYDCTPSAIALDKHPEYLSTKLGKDFTTNNQIPTYNIQHHHAHIAACMAENNIPLDTPPILGIALDGLGYGDDGTFWGGEFLLADYKQFQRLAKFKSVAMIGGEKAIYQPWRSLYAHLISNFNWQYLKQEYGDLDLFKFLEDKPLDLMRELVLKKINSPLASSVGRLFDAVAAAIGICREECSYEGQAAMELESLVDINYLNNDKISSYRFSITQVDGIQEIELDLMWLDILKDLSQSKSSKLIASKFHQTLILVLVKVIENLRKCYSINQVALTGGVFQNSILLQQVTKHLKKSNIHVLTHSLIPSNDGSLSLGQAVIAAARSIH
ncbi:carbamoyltransferase HypF [Calothrix sp. PCC 6303]|uniref:carbamoyltransferase HypF n=1 Tax=Calothrix sp. PCC 6303 TaxID=1170562 RepID=UPI0002A02C22|nr:carbamoyltransferase HypF [Calothrix sp. PCC 6303]AFY99570.1 (NiFe) hydrogenase maturation protein HypF [Calothrix sp. PCC 6303]